MLQRAQKVRISFCKEKNLKFLSPTDLARTIRGALTRAQLPLVYQGRFSAKPELSFCPPAPTGAESRCELAEFYLTDYIKYEEIAEKLNQTLPEGIVVSKAYRPDTELKKIVWAEYQMIFTVPGLCEKSLQEVRKLFLEPAMLPADMADFMHLKNAELREDNLILEFDLSVQGQSFVKPLEVAGYVRKKLSFLSEETDFRMIRTAFLQESMQTFE